MTRETERAGLPKLLQTLFGSENAHFIEETLQNSAVFCVIGGVALLIQAVVHWEEEKGGSPFLIGTLTFTEGAILIADVFWFLSRLYVSTYKVVLRARRDTLEAKATIVPRREQQPEPLDPDHS